MSTTEQPATKLEEVSAIRTYDERLLATPRKMRRNMAAVEWRKEKKARRAAIKASGKNVRSRQQQLHERRSYGQ